MKIIENYLYKEKKHFYLFNTINLILVRNFMKFESVEIVRRMKKFYRVNRIIKLGVKLSEAIILFIVQQHYAENRREKGTERDATTEFPIERRRW